MGAAGNEPMARHRYQGLLLRYVAHVQRTGRCHYPPLELHLRQWAQERRLQEEQAPQEQAPHKQAEEERQPDSQTGPQQEHETPALQTAPHERDAVPEPVPIPRPEQDLRREPISRQPLPPEPRASLPAAAEPMPPTAQAAAQEPAPALEPATPPGAPLLAPAGGTTASTAPAAPSTPATADDGADRANPQLERLLRFREEVQRSGRCDHPELMERVGAHLAARQLDRGNSREALERLRLRCQVQMARIRSDLSAHGDQSHASCMAIGHRLGQLRALLDDGFRSYASQLDPPLRRMVRRQLRRAAALERTLMRRQRRTPATGPAWSELELLASCLEGALDQWLPSTAGSLRLAPRPESANAIRPAAVPQRGS